MPHAPKPRPKPTHGHGHEPKPQHEPNVRYVVRYKDEHGNDHAYQRAVYMGTAGTVSIEFPPDCQWPPEAWRQIVVEFSPAEKGK